MRVRRYETVFVLRPDLDDAETKELAQKLENVVAKEQGSMVKREDWGVRKLAYDINRFSKGYYFLFDYVGPTRLIGELERVMKINENVMRFLTIKKSDHVDMEAIQKEREEAQKRQEEARRVAAWDTRPEEDKQEVSKERKSGLVDEGEEAEEEEEEEEEEAIKDYEEDDTSLEEEDEEEEENEP